MGPQRTPRDRKKPETFVAEPASAPSTSPAEGTIYSNLVVIAVQLHSVPFGPADSDVFYRKRQRSWQGTTKRERAR